MVPISNTHAAESLLNSAPIIATETEQQQNEIDRGGRFRDENQTFSAQSTDLLAKNPDCDCHMQLRALRWVTFYSDRS